MLTEPIIQPLDNGIRLVITIYCLVAVIFVVCMLILCYLLCTHDRKSSFSRTNSDVPLVFQTNRHRSTALKSPSGAGVNTNGGTHYLKKAVSLSDSVIPKQMPSTSSSDAVLVDNDLKVNDDNDCKSIDGDNSKNCLGSLLFKIKLKKDKNALIITIMKCSNLPFKDPNTIDPYVKLQLLPDKHHKVKTRVLRKTCNPNYDEEFTFYGIEKKFLNDVTLHFIVLSFDRYSRDEVLGEAFVPLNELDLSLIETQQLTCNWDIMPKNYNSKYHIRGELLVSLCWQPVASRLTVVILKARNLPKMDLSGLADPYVKINLLLDGQKVAKKKTHIKKHTLNPVFNESFVFDLPESDSKPILSRVRLEFLVFDWDRVTKNEVIGRLVLGSESTLNSAINHWKEVNTSPRRQIAEWHKLNE